MAMKTKKLYIIFFTLLALIFGGSAGTFAYLKDSKSNNGNIIATGEYPKPQVNIYASAGPLFKGALTELGDYESPNYESWLINASDYIIKDLKGTPPSGGAVGSGYTEFRNLSNNMSTNVTNNIGSEKFKSWKGKVNECSNEHGTIVHYVVAITNPAKDGLSYGKISLNDQSINIVQKDVFKSTKGRYEYVVERDSKSLDIKSNPNRVLTFDWVNGQYVRTGSKNNPANSADLIIFDVGGKGYYSLSSYYDNQSLLDNLRDKLLAKKPHATWGYITKKWYTGWVGVMHDVVMNHMVPMEDVYCNLDRTECSIGFTYKDYTVPTKKHIVKFNKSIINSKSAAQRLIEGSEEIKEERIENILK